MRAGESFVEGGWLTRVADWLSARAAIVLLLLMVQLGVLVALFQMSGALGGPAAAAKTRGGRAGCGMFEVVFSPAADLRGLRQWALNFDAQVVAGPNSRGAFELSAPQMGTDDLREALGPLADDVRPNPLCPPEAPAP